MSQSVSELSRKSVSESFRELSGNLGLKEENVSGRIRVRREVSGRKGLKEEHVRMSLTLNSRLILGLKEESVESKENVSGRVKRRECQWKS